MRLETFFEKFDLFADASDAVTKMRELVLDLAIQGKLVGRRASDGEGHSLLEKLRTLPPERNSKSRSPRDIAVEPETPLEIPNHWALTTVENTTRETGFFCDGDWVESKDQDPHGDVRLIQLADVGDGQYRDRSSRFLTKAAATRLNCSYLEAGDILVARMPDPIGRCCRFPGDPKPAVTVVDVCILRPNVTFFDADFLVVAINSPRFRRLVLAQATGTTRSRISRSNLGVLPIPLPPLAEQKRIVAKVDELMALCDQLEAQQQERETRHAALARASLARFAEAPTPANLDLLFHKSYSIAPDDLRKSILTLAVQGKLVPQYPNEESAKECLARIGLTNTHSVDEAEDSLPSSWDRVRFEDIALIAGGVTLGRKLGNRRTVSLPYLRVANVKRGEIDLGVVKEVIIARDEIERYALREHDLLMTEGGDWDKVGRAAVWKGQIPICLHQNHVFRSRMRSDEISPLWFERYFNSPEGRRYFESASKQTTNLASINMRQVRGCPVPFPPLAEQRRIVVKVNELMALVDALESQQAAAGIAGAKLVEAVVAELTAVARPRPDRRCPTVDRERSVEELVGAAK
ncbi:MAG: restriction endonuclease subunit S [Burkholderiales bacterium]